MNRLGADKIKNLVDPKNVYVGFFETFLIRPFLHRYADFRGSDSGRTCAFSLLAWLILTLGLVGALTGLVGLLGPEVGFTALYVVGALWLAFSIVPVLALIVRAGNHPLPGKRIFNPEPGMLPIDWILTGISVMFFVCGILMMSTTLHSEVLDPNAGYIPEMEETKFVDEEIVEEPIFTYQNPETTDTAFEDTLDLGDNSDAVDLDESFDPTIQTIPTDMPEMADSIR